MSKTAELRQKRGELWDKAKAFLNEHADENGMMNAEDTATYERMEKDIDSFGAAIDREERAERLERERIAKHRADSIALADSLAQIAAQQEAEKKKLEQEAAEKAKSEPMSM